MSTAIILVPSKLGPKEAISLSNEIEAQKSAKIITLDFKKSNWLEPFAMLFVSGIVTKIRTDFGTRIVAQNYTHLDYAKHMGFFHACGLSVGKKIGQAKGSETYLPISELIFHPNTLMGEKSYTVVQDQIEKQAGALAEMLLKENATTELLDVVTYSITELGRNVYEHSKADRLYYAAQFWPATAKVEICIADHGCGIHKSIANNKFLVPKDNFDSLNMCLLPGISGKGNVLKGDSHDHWDNSGFGLFMIASLCSEGGNMLLISQSDGLYLKNGKRHQISTLFSGTAIRMQLNTTNIGNLNTMLAGFVKSGEAIAREITNMEEVTASTASGMVSRHFK